MRKKSLLTKVVALGATATLLASTTAFAATYSTRTLYLTSDPNTAYVSTTVTGLDAGDEVTYLAGYTGNSTPVYINQFTAEGANLTFKYKTSKDNLGTSKEIKMAKADKTFTVNGTVTPATAGEDKIPEAQKFTFKVTVNAGAEQAIAVNAGDVIDAGKITLTGIKLGADTLNTTAKLNGADTGVNVNADGNVVVTLPTNFVTYNDATLELTKTEAALVLTTTPAVEPAVSYTVALKSDKATLTIKDANNADYEIKDARMYVVYGAAIGSASEYGIAVSESVDPATASDVKYYPASADENGAFGVAIVDDGKDAFTAYIRTYYKATSDSNPVLTTGNEALKTISFVAVSK